MITATFILLLFSDGFTARLVENAGFNLTFMTGFGVSASYGTPDTGLLGAGEMISAASVICGSLRRIPCIGKQFNRQLECFFNFMIIR
jgi:2-methylisocitrate lyase-like PEP mutase family enzyme